MIKNLCMVTYCVIQIFLCPSICHATGTADSPCIADMMKSDAQKGLFNVYCQDNRYYFEIPDSLLGRDMLLTNTIVKGSVLTDRFEGQIYGFAGDLLETTIVRFIRKDSGNIHMLVPYSFPIVPDATEGYDYMAIKGEAIPIAEYFTIKATGEGSSLLDITDMLERDHPLFSLKNHKKNLNIGNYQADRSFVAWVKSYHDNVSIRLIKSYQPGVSMRGNNAEMNPTRWEIGISLCMLPKESLRKRYEDPRVGYYTTKFDRLSKVSYGLSSIQAVQRWRLEPKPEDKERYARGELVEPVKPIVFYVDRNVPAALLPYFVEGVNAWQKAFEKAGFKNAIIGKIVPTMEEDPSFSIENANVSLISYKLAPVQNAFGPNMYDLRSGEILRVSISIFHSALDLMQKWYFSQCANIDPRARVVPMPDDIIGEMARFVVAHEVGHTLGLKHNYGGSATSSIGQVRDRDYVKRYGFGASIMDYTRCNYVAQIEDNLDTEDLIPRLGDYDEFAIEWAYRYFPEFETSEQEYKYLVDWVSERREQNPRTVYGPENDPRNPAFQRDDVGDNHMEANALGMKNLRETTINCVEWSRGEDVEFATLKSRYLGIQEQYNHYILHVLNYLGGRLLRTVTRDENAEIWTPVSREKHLEAIAFIDKYFFNVPEWLFRKELLEITGSDPEKIMSVLSERYLSSLFVFLQSDNTSYTPEELLNDLVTMIFREFQEGTSVSPYRKIIQAEYLKKIESTLARANPRLEILLLRQLQEIKDLASALEDNDSAYPDKKYAGQIVRQVKKHVKL